MSLFPQSAAAVGIDFSQVCETIVGLALAPGRRGNKVQS
jgi:D-alanine-D-alanine ligase-like ATP-grasp enzyme